jgi:hypothetical protein
MKYIETILKHFNMQDCKPMKVPIPVGARLTLEQCPRTQEEIKYMVCVPNAIFVGSIMYVMFYTRLDIVHEVELLSRYMLTPRKEHCTIVKRVFRYLCDKKYYTRCYQGKPGGENELNVHGFVNVN